ncbi:hypothetical protein LTR08_000503 [Meristemomyces frigidus]|nr:hypothetical protein LTR08_000503 [Meristemomyces frigidus]
MFAAFTDIAEYLNFNNRHRIVGLFANDPFAIFGFVLLLLMIPVALVLLTVTARRSTYSIFDGIRHEARYRRLQRAARTSLLPTSHPRASRRSNRATAGSKRVRFRPVQSPPVSPKTRIPSKANEGSHPLENTGLQTLPVPRVAARASLTGSTFEDVFDRWHQARRASRVDVELEDAETQSKWTSEFHTELRVSAFMAGLR